ncbi:MAG: hypothetical protein IT337_09230 [Thermomicrobiales bacterium]|nr:hypothetical protein [Thermomicrobiales bacterium]
MQPPYAAYDRPYCWWDPAGRAPAAPDLPDLIVGGALSAPVAALLLAAMARGASIVVVAEPSGAGKTTLLTALTRRLPSPVRRCYLRGCYDRLTLLNDPTVDPTQTVLLINEISPHLPHYLWGDGVGRVLAATERGFRLAATAHAADAVGFVRLLTAPPLRLPAPSAAAFDLVVALESARPPAAALRRVSGLWALSARPPAGVEIMALGRGHEDLSELLTRLTAARPQCPRLADIGAAKILHALPTALAVAPLEQPGTRPERMLEETDLNERGGETVPG